MKIRLIKHTYRVFIYDNSGSESVLILEIFKGRGVTINSANIPELFDKYILNR